MNSEWISGLLFNISSISCRVVVDNGMPDALVFDSTCSGFVAPVIAQLISSLRSI
ncbi:MAG: hypothetical protein ACFFC6_17805 [Promethearchaeota archaeon]